MRFLFDDWLTEYWDSDTYELWLLCQKEEKDEEMLNKAWS